MENRKWISSILRQDEKEMEEMFEYMESEFYGTRSIYKVPNFFRNHNMEAFQPHMVSFGPYHHGEEQVKGMESLKRKSVLHLFKVTKKPIKICLSNLEKMIYELEDNYANFDPEWGSENEFIELMFIDGCFMLEILLSDHPTFNIPSIDEYVKSGIFGSEEKYILGHIRRDMLLIENQLPLQVLVSLASTVFQLQDTIAHHFIIGLIMRFFSLPEWEGHSMGQQPIFLHILDMYYSFHYKVGSNKSNFPTHEMMPSATKLDEAGFKFLKSNTDMDFENGYLKFPKFTVDSATESRFLNLMAYELLHSSHNLQLVSSVAFFTSIVHTSKDVSLLQSKDIISNLLGSEEEVTKMFHVLSKAVRSISVESTNTQQNDPRFSAVKMHYKNQMSACKRRFREWGRNLHDTHFKNPWSFLSVMAAVILLALTVVQTVYTILSFYK